MTCLYHTHICGYSPAPNGALWAKSRFKREGTDPGAGPGVCQREGEGLQLELGELPALLLGEL